MAPILNLENKNYIPANKTELQKVQKGNFTMTNNRVLICDDSRSIRLITKRLLQENGYQVVGEASNGQEATEAFIHHNPDLVLLDLVMPETDGQTALRQIVEHNPSAKVVILSSLGSESDVEECLRSGASSYIQKPFEEDILLNALNELQ